MPNEKLRRFAKETNMCVLAGRKKKGIRKNIVKLVANLSSRQAGKYMVKLYRLRL